MCKSVRKRCPRCGKLKDVLEFYRSDGRSTSWCQDCLREYQRESYSDRVGGVRPRIQGVRAIDEDGSVVAVADSYKGLERALIVPESTLRNAAARGSKVLGSMTIEEVREP